MAKTAFRFAKEEPLAIQLGFGSLLAIELAEQIQLGSRGKSQDLLKFRHRLDLGPAFEDGQSLLGGLGRIAIEISGSLLELGDVLDALERSFGSEQPLHVHAA